MVIKIFAFSYQLIISSFWKVKKNSEEPKQKLFLSAIFISKFYFLPCFLIKRRIPSLSHYLGIKTRKALGRKGFAILILLSVIDVALSILLKLEGF